MQRWSFLFSAAALSVCTVQPARAQRATPQLKAQWSVPVSQVRSQIGRHVPHWSATDLGLASTFVTLLWADAGQTRAFARTGWNGVREANPLLGPRPSVERINLYTAAAAVATLGVGSLLPERVRRWWFMGAISVELYALVGNARTRSSLR